MKLAAKHCTVAKQHDVKQPSQAGSRLGPYLKMFTMGQSICVPNFMLLTQSARLSQNPALPPHYRWSPHDVPQQKTWRPP